jgi:hypothetical protein
MLDALRLLRSSGKTKADIEIERIGLYAGQLRLWFMVTTTLFMHNLPEAPNMLNRQYWAGA